jgi:hypothetical protein
VPQDVRSLFADWLVLLSGLVLFVSLFLTWSHLSPAYVALANRLQTLEGVPRDPTAWQVYSAADVLLAALAAALVGVALTGARKARIATLVACVLALGFTIHAAGVAPTNGAANAFRPSADVPSFVAPSPASGVGEVMAIVAVIGAIGGLSVSLATE